MISKINFSGLTNSPSDYECPDGELSAAMNLVPEDGTLKPVFEPDVLFSLPEGYNVVLIHTANTKKHYIVQDDSFGIYWIDAQDESHELNLIDNLANYSVTKIYQFNSTGNVLLVLTDNGIFYFLWQKDKYNNLGNHLPELNLSFGLKGQIRSKFINVDFKTQYNPATFPGDFNNDENIEYITNQVLGGVNSMIAEYCNHEEDDGTDCFMFPFFVRYAYRLYNGDLTMHSAPVLMLPSTKYAPVCAGYFKSTFPTNGCSLTIYSFLADLDYDTLTTEPELAKLNMFKDIISSVDIFISAPLYTYDQSGKVKLGSYGVRESLSTYYLAGIENGTYKKRLMDDDFPETSTERMTFNLPRFEDSKVTEKIKDCGTFYLLHSIKLSELEHGNRKKIPIEKGYLKSLVTREVMTDDNNHHDLLIPKRSYSYNSRLNITGIERKPFSGFRLNAMVPYINEADNDMGHTYIPSWSISNGNDTLNVSAEASDVKYAGNYFFYPDGYVDYFGITRRMGLNTEYFTTKPSPHPLLNGSFYFSGFDEITFSGSPSIVQPEQTTDKIFLPNKLYASEVNNPFYFPVNGIKSVGTGEIYDICAAVKAMSQGQYGQFPLYVFSSEGVWALSIADDGTFGPTPPPVANDVCSNINSITPLDSSVLFVSSRGLMLLSGSECVCISDVVQNLPFDHSGLPSFNKIQEMSQLPELPSEDFRDFIQYADIVYDYINQRIIIFREGYQKAFVFSLKSKCWGMCECHFRNTVNSFPDAYVMNDSNQLVNVSTVFDTSDSSAIMAVTRPLKLDSPDVLKTIDTVILRGNFKRGDISTALYGSRDLANWHLVRSSKDNYIRGFCGTPYKYFRIAFVGRLKYGQNITAVSISFNERYNDKLK